jgi:Pentapeptide repeats (8 copies)
MIRIIRQLSGILVGIVLGVALAVYIQQPRRQWAVLNVLLVLCGLGILLVAAYLIGRAMLHRYQRKVDVSWMETLGTTLLQSTYDANARTEAARMLAEGREQMRNLVRLVLAFVGLSHALTSVILVLGSVVGVATLMTAYMQVERLDRQNELLVAQNAKLDVQSQLAEAGRRATLASELSSILDEIGAERKQSPTRPRADAGFPPSPEVVGRIVALTRSLRPYRYLELEDESNDGASGGGITAVMGPALSPERAQLLLSLLSSGVDLKLIYNANADFSYADLRGVILTSVDLGSDETGILLSRADFRGSKLDEADLSGATLSSVDFTDTRLRRANLSRARLIGANLTRADLLRADLRNAQLVRAVLRDTDFNGADLRGANLMGARLPGAEHFAAARMSGTNLLGAHPPSADWLARLRRLPRQPVGLDWEAWRVVMTADGLRIERGIQR